MARADNLYSRVVAWVKILLPIAALALLSTLFLVARGPGTDAAIPFAEVDLAQLARDRGIQAPNFAAVTEAGHALQLSATRATPRPADRRILDAEALQAELDMTDGQQIRLTAQNGVIDNVSGEADLFGGVVVRTVEGHVVKTERLIAELATATLRSAGPVMLSGSRFTAEAGQMLVQATEPGTDTVIMVFKDGVRLIYEPEVN